MINQVLQCEANVNINFNKSRFQPIQHQKMTAQHPKSKLLYFPFANYLQTTQRITFADKKQNFIKTKILKSLVYKMSTTNNTIEETQSTKNSSHTQRVLSQ